MFTSMSLDYRYIRTMCSAIRIIDDEARKAVMSDRDCSPLLALGRLHDAYVDHGCYVEVRNSGATATRFGKNPRTTINLTSTV